MSRRLVVEADGGSRGNPGPAGYGALVRDATTGEVIAEVASAIGVATNNVAEYGGLVAGLQAAVALDPAAQVEVRMDSKLVVEQMSGRWRVKHEALRPLAAQAAELVRRLAGVTFTWVPRERNSAADRLANEAMDDAAAGRTWTRREQRPDPAQPEPLPAARRVPEVAGPRPAGPPGTGSRETAPPNRLSGWSEAPAPPTTTFLLRHGQTEHNVRRRFSGRNDHGLTDLGRAQAEAAASRLVALGRVEVVVSSPLPRARETAHHVARGLGVDLQVHDGLAETDFGAWEGFSFAEVRERWPRELDAWLADESVAPPDGESFRDTEERVAAARDEVVAGHRGQVVLLVAHVTPIKTLVRLALQAPPQALYRMHVDSASIAEVDWFDDGPAVLRRFNETAHLDALAPSAAPGAAVAGRPSAG